MENTVSNGVGQIDLDDLQTNNIFLLVACDQSEFSDVLDDRNAEFYKYYPDDKFPTLMVHYFAEMEDSQDLYDTIVKAVLSVQCQNVQYITLLQHNEAERETMDEIADCLVDAGATYEIDQIKIDTGTTCYACSIGQIHPDCDEDGPKCEILEPTDMSWCISHNYEGEDFYNDKTDFDISVYILSVNDAFKRQLLTHVSKLVEEEQFNMSSLSAGIEQLNTVE